MLNFMNARVLCKLEIFRLRKRYILTLRQKLFYQKGLISMKKVVTLLLCGAMLLSPVCMLSMGGTDAFAHEVEVMSSGSEVDGVSYTYTIFNGSALITDMILKDKDKTELTIPSYFLSSEGKKVPVSGIYGGYGLNSKIEKVILPSSVRTIGASVFRDQKALKSINLENVWWVQDNAFSGSGLEGVVDLRNASEIRYGAFMGCKGITSVKFYRNVSEIEMYAFKDCTSLDIAKLTSGFSNGLYLGHCAFENTGIKNIELNNLRKDKEVVIGDSAVDSYVFKDCVKLESVVMRSSVGKYMFSGCTSLKKVSFVGAFKCYIGMGAFSGCTSLTDIENYHKESQTSGVFYDSELISVGSNAFENCTSLVSLDVTKYCTKLGTDVFKGCTSLKEVYMLNEGDVSISDGSICSDIYHPIRVVIVGNAHNIPLEKKCADCKIAYRVIDEEEVTYPEWYSQSDPVEPTPEPEPDTDTSTDTESDTDSEKSPISWGDLDPFNPFTPGKPKDTDLDTDNGKVKDSDSDKKDSDTDNSGVKDSDSDVKVKDTDSDSGKVKDSDTDTKLKDSDSDTDNGKVKDSDTDIGKVKDSDTDVGKVKDSDTDTKVKDTDTDKKDTDSGKKVYYTVVFDFNVKGWDSVTQKVEKGMCAVTPKNSLREGYTFEGWYSNGKRYDFKNPITSDMVFKAKWVEVEPSKPSTHIMGDIDGDGKVTSADSLTVLRASVGLEKVSDELKSIVDIDKDGRITSADSLSILRASVGLEKL